MHYHDLFPSGSCHTYLGNSLVLIDEEENNVQLNGELALWFKILYPSLLKMMKTESLDQVKESIMNSLVSFFCNGCGKDDVELREVYC